MKVVATTAAGYAHPSRSVWSGVRTRVEQPVEAAVVEQVWNQFADLGPLERHAIDTDTLGPGETAELLAERLDLLS
jgi:hypothetical protein